jgi:hypothetical protein
MAHRNRDARQAADQTATNNLKAAQTAVTANRVNQNSPWGSTIYTDNGNGTWTVDQVLTPQQQALFDKQQQTQAGMLGGVQNALSRLDYGPVTAGPIQTSLDLSGLPAIQSNIDTGGMLAFPVSPGQTAQDAIMSRLQPALTRQHDQLRSELVNQGFNLGDEGYMQGMDEFTRQANDAYTQAGMYGISLALQQRGQQFGEAQANANLANTANLQGYNERLGAAQYGLAAQNQQFEQNMQNANRPAQLAAMLSGQYQPIQAPGAYNVSVPQQATMPGADYLGALQAANQDRANSNSQRAGLYGGIGNFALGAGMLGVDAYKAGLFGGGRGIGGLSGGF